MTGPRKVRWEPEIEGLLPPDEEVVRPSPNEDAVAAAVAVSSGTVPARNTHSPGPFSALHPFSRLHKDKKHGWSAYRILGDYEPNKEDEDGEDGSDDEESTSSDFEYDDSPGNSGSDDEGAQFFYNHSPGPQSRRHHQSNDSDHHRHGTANGQSPASLSPEVSHERLEWQQMLQSVLMGEVIKSEKKRLLSTDQLKLEQKQPIEDIWVSLRALLRGRTIEQEKKYLEEARHEVNEVLTLLMEFRIDPTLDMTALDQVAEVLKTVDRVESLYSTRADMIQAYPAYAAPAIQQRLDALNAWCTVTRSLHMQNKILQDWTGSEDLQIAHRQHHTTTTTANANDPSFVERILKESALQDTFDKRTLSALHSLLVKAKQTMVHNNSIFAEIGLPSFIAQLRRLASFPTSLVEEALKLRLEYRDRIDEAPKPMVDTMMEDYRGLLTLACRVKLQYEELAHPAPGWDLQNDAFIDSNYDSALVESVRSYFKLIAWKLNNEKDNTLRECEVMEKEWEFLRSTVCQAVDIVEWECAEQFCQFTNRLLSSLIQDYTTSLETLPQEEDNEAVEFKYTQLLHSVRMRARKLFQFSKFFISQFENAIEYVISDDDCLDQFMQRLADTGHFLVYTGAFEDDRCYMIASPSLYQREGAIIDMVKQSFRNDASSPQTPGTPASEQPDDYILLISPWQDMVWPGVVINASIPYVSLGIRTRRMRLIFNISDSKRLHSIKSKLHAPSGIEVVQEHRANIPKVNKELLRIKGTIFRLADFVISSVNMIRKQTHYSQACQELIEECFSFASDFGVRTARFLEFPARAQLDLKLVRLAIDWISYITDECIPTDRKTFRWAVAALEFGHMMTRGTNVLALEEEEFAKLQSKVARCIALLISHFDVLGTRWKSHEAQLKEEQKRNKRGITGKRNSYMTNRTPITTSSTFGAGNDAASGAAGVTYIRDAWMRKIFELENTRNASEQERSIVGKVLDDQKPEDQSLVFLAPSATNISFRWQQGRFIGAGTFGSVYLAINLDTSSVMAVKEIRFPDSTTLSSLHKAIKEEMKVMEMLNHDNIVQYFGMEVHRDKVFIFMEYCENGSLGTLLEHGGRIEDEFYIVNYAYQLLKGLAYLHENNIVHRDIKPDNILLDYQGHPKLSDFGASKILAKGQKTMGKTTMNMNLNSLAGTPMYMAPEVITGGDTGRKGSMDIWSLACCIVQMATGRRPWSTLENEWSVMYHVVTGHPPLPDPSQLSSTGIDFLKKSFTRNSSKRPTAQELLSHPWITDFLETCEAAGRNPPDDIRSPRSLDNSVTSADDIDPPLVRSIRNSLALATNTNGFDYFSTCTSSSSPRLSPGHPSNHHANPQVFSRDFALGDATPGVLSRHSSTSSLVRSVTEDEILFTPGSNHATDIS
ncbi:hypothetical protein BCR43DRAFT_483367 [Syncephalastrum racemosum]|uniref:Protein kinase domain-containing protein n=1 Tax=Syncephalastrum racemosum TaxID=13706 RepID=A0A1X2HV44_SYNRA|nr:hypothetical protein BCR43DRAFT_483367 [Syncephalastrum racemosum]